MTTDSHQKQQHFLFGHGCLLDDGLPTLTSRDQKRVERSVAEIFASAAEAEGGDEAAQRRRLLTLLREEHCRYLKESLFGGLSDAFTALDCSRPWMVYWIAHSLALLGERKFLVEHEAPIVDFLGRCRSAREGGYSGSPQQEAHLAATYAAVNALVTVGGRLALGSIDRASLGRFLAAMAQPDGAFTVHASGEVDIRGAYCALSVARLLNIPIYDSAEDSSNKNDLFSKTADWILRCQTYEGGFGAAPGHEAHGGYTFCGVAALVMLGELHRADLDALLRWTANKQMRLEGGFCGRTNKLVDGCYSFWNGAVIPIVQSWLGAKENKPFPSGWLLDAAALQQYILACCQHRRGGLLDKPGKSRDFYHTCYTLSGLSVAQHSPAEDSPLVLGPSEEEGGGDNEVEKVHPLFNVTLGALEGARQFFFDHREEAAEVQEEEGEEEEEGDQTTSEPMEEKEV